MEKKTNKKLGVKEIILENYNVVLNEKIEKESRILDPEKEILKRTNNELLNKTEGLLSEDTNSNTESVKSEFENIVKLLNERLTGTIENIELNKKDINIIDDAIKIKEIELSDISKSESSAFKISKVVRVQQDEIENIEINHKKQVEDENQSLEELKEKIIVEKKEFEEEMKEDKIELDKIRTQKEEEFNYEFEKAKKIELDKFEDRKNQLNKEVKDEIEREMKVLDEKEKEISEKEEQVLKNEENLEKLKAEVEKYPDVLKKLKEETEVKTKEKVKSELTLKETYLKKDYEGQKEVLKNEIEHLESIISDLEGKNTELANKLDGAYEKIQNMALKTVESSYKLSNNDYKAVG